jgi:hypothetical protein
MSPSPPGGAWREGREKEKQLIKYTFPSSALAENSFHVPLGYQRVRPWFLLTVPHGTSCPAGEMPEIGSLLFKV